MRSVDTIYQRPQSGIQDFRFDQDTADVFDNMLERSVPFYGELQRMVAQLSADFCVDGSRIVDLGCSTGTSIAKILELCEGKKSLEFFGIDCSAEMLKKAEAKLSSVKTTHRLHLVHQDLNDDLNIFQARVVTMILTLQFVRPMKRQNVLKKIHEGLEPGGAFILVEKVLGNHSILNRLFIDHYYQFKRENGYSDLEISQKREALENVLIPYKEEENKEILREIGFQKVETFFKWYNFCAMIAVK